MGKKIVYPIVNIEKMRKLKRKKQDYKMNPMVLVHVHCVCIIRMFLSRYFFLKWGY